MNWGMRIQLTLLAMAWGLLVHGAATAQPLSPLTFATDHGRVHIMPSATDSPILSNFAGDPGPLLYNGGPIMPSANIYAIFWIPKTLQTGAATGVSTNYVSVQTAMLASYPGHAISSINTQYYQSTPSTYISGKGSLAGVFTDTAPYPASGCADPSTPGACLSDMQIQSEITKVMKKKHWKAGFSNIFMLFTSSGEGSCVDPNTCAYTYYCAYHGFFGSFVKPVIYSNEPYGEPSVCQKPGTPSPNSDANADTASTAASHELSEAITDPELDAWYTALGNENGDLCAYNYGANGWDGALANQMWGGNFFELQMEFDNHTGSCAQIGP